MENRRSFLQKILVVGAASCVPMLGVAKPKPLDLTLTEASDYDFTVTHMEDFYSEINFQTGVRGIARLDHSPDGLVHTCYFAFLKEPEIYVDVKENIGDNIRRHFRHKFCKVIT